jgi:hypothetical protein
MKTMILSRVRGGKRQVVVAEGYCGERQATPFRVSCAVRGYNKFNSRLLPPVTAFFRFMGGAGRPVLPFFRRKPFVA